MDDRKGSGKPDPVTWGLVALALFAGGAVGWRAAHRGGPRAAGVPDPPAVVTASESSESPAEARTAEAPAPARGPSASIRRAPVVAAAVASRDAAVPAAIRGGEEAGPGRSSRAPRAGAEAWYLAEFCARAEADPDGFASMARERLADAGAPLAEKAALLRAARQAGPSVADALFAAALDAERTRDPAVREAAAGFLLRDLQAPRPDPAAWERLRAFALGGTRTDEALRARVAGPIFASAPARALDAMAVAAERDPDPAFVRGAWLGLMRNGAPGARGMADDIARRRGWDPEEALIAVSGGAGAGE